MAGRSRTAEQTIAAVARRRHGVVTRELLLAAGLTRHEIDGRLSSGALIPVHRGVFRAGHAAPSVEATYLAAILACGRGSLLGGFAACQMLRLTDGAGALPTVWSPAGRRVPGVTCRRYRDPDFARRRRVISGIPVVSVPRALVDAAAFLPLDALALACHKAGVRYRTTPRQVDEVLPPGAPGRRKLRAVMTGDEQATLSRLEKAFRALLRAEGLPRAQTNKVASARRVDCRWPEHAVTVELDSFTFHNSRHSWQRDREREREAYARGDDFRRYSWADVLEDPGPMLRELRKLLS